MRNVTVDRLELRYFNALIGCSILNSGANTVLNFVRFFANGIACVERARFFDCLNQKLSRSCWRQQKYLITEICVLRVSSPHCLTEINKLQ